MLFRFSLYGFLKNQRYFEPFFILFLLEKGLSFSQIGFLISSRELFINLIEVPSGAFADLYGRRYSMILSFSSYILSFLIFAAGVKYFHFFIAMFFFAIGDGFRTGTHKAIIFSWLRTQNRINEKTKIYGITRSWSKTGSAVSIIIATVIMLTAENYSNLFYFALIPYAVGLINFATYPKSLDADNKSPVTFIKVYKHFKNLLKKSFTLKPLRRLISETMGYEGVFTAGKDYIQPVIQSFAVSVPIFITLEKDNRTAVMVGIVYLILYILSAYASRKSHLISLKLGSERKGIKFIWKVTSLCYLFLIPLFYFEIYLAAILLFAILFLMQNLWRPVQISRFDEFATEQEGATILSIESQAKSFATMIIAPVIGVLVDLAIKYNLGGEFWVIAFLGSVVSIYFAFRK
ncbi:MAG: MFS transporter [Melioribacteraceae bacterium]|nr:MFS transporter [Melioribacteraceae bacterium]